MADDTETIDDLIANSPEMIDTFVTEAKEHLDAAEDDFLKLEKQQDHPDRALMDKVFRAIHSVKAAVGFLGLANMSKLAHVMETLLGRMRAGELLPESEYIDALLGGVDLLAAMLDDIEHSDAVDIARVYERLCSLTGQEVSPTVEGEKRAAARPSEESGSAEAAAGQGVETPVVGKSIVDFGNSVRIQVDILDKLMILAGELVLVRNRHLRSVDDSDPVSRFISQQLDIVTSELQETVIRTRMQPIGKLFGKFPRMVRELEKKLDKQIQIDIRGSEAELDKTILESLADPLIHIIRNSCSHGIETPAERVKAGKPKSGRITVGAYHEAGRVNIEIRDDGRGIDLDLVRRKALDKGLRTEADLDAMSDREVINLVTLPGFSTVDKVSDVFGRGVGMDVVRTGIEKLGGSLDLESSLGEGTTIHLRLPLTLAIIPCLIVTVGGYRYAIPQNSLEELVCLYDEEVKTKVECADDQEVYRLRDRLLPMVRLSEVLAMPVPFTRDGRAEITERYRNEQERVWQEYVNAVKEKGGTRFIQSLSFVVLKAGAGHFGLIVDQIQGTEEIVVKPMHSAVKSLSIYSGATIMGDGQATLILDVEGIARHAGIMVEGRVDTAEEEMDRAGKKRDLQTVLLFGYGEKEQFAMSLTLIRRIEPVSMSSIEKIGDREYITIDGTSTLILRLDQALNVSPIVEREEMFLILPRHIKQPVALLASSLIDTEETPIELNVESYTQDGVLGTAIIRDSMTLFIDIYRLVELIEPEWFAERRMGQFGTAGPPPESAKQILLLEDSPFFRYLVKGYLEADGYRVTTAEHGQMGLDLMNDTEFDLIVSDLDMPVMDGWAFVRSVRQREDQRDIPAIALTALDSESDRHSAMECGFSCYEVKLDRERFLTSVAELLGRKKVHS
ncbi:MAG: chemotaxis protein CheW [Thermodesulfobacteriota bacterium]|nr:chemotaxis protein CheW [Thermodesulfobacteriota bacterium]